MRKRYDVERLPMFEDDDNSIRGNIDDVGDIGDEVAELLDTTDTSDILEDPNKPDDEGDDRKDDKDKDEDVDKKDEKNKDDKPDDDKKGEDDKSGKDSDATPDKGREPDDKDDKPPIKSDDESPKVKELEDKIATLITTVASLKEPKPEPEPEKKVEIEPTDLTELFKDTDFDKVMETKEEFLTFLAKAIAADRSVTTDSIMNSMPSVIEGVVNRQSSMKEIGRKFYEDNPELVKAKKYVKLMARDVSTADGNLTMSEILEEAAKRTRTDLELKPIEKDDKDDKPDDKDDKSDTKDKDKDSGKPELPGGSSSTRGKEVKTSKQQQEIDDLLDD